MLVYAKYKLSGKMALVSEVMAQVPVIHEIVPHRNLTQTLPIT